MKHLTKCLCILFIVLFAMQACIEKDYDWNDMDKSGVIKIPPVPLGSIDTIFLDKLAVGGSIGIPIPGGAIVLTDTIRGLFDDDAVEDFFFEGAGAVEITSSEICAFSRVEGVKIDLHFGIINHSDEKITEVVIPAQTLVTGINQDISIKIAPEYMKYMQGARHLLLTIVISSEQGVIYLGKEDFIFLKNVIVRNGGLHVKL